MSLYKGSTPVAGSTVLDPRPVAGSTRGVTSGGLYDALEKKQDRDPNLCYESKNIEQDFTLAELSAKIQAGDYSGLSCGNYIERTIPVDGSNYDVRIVFADFDTFYGGYSSYSITDKHHVGCIVLGLPNHQWNSDGTTTTNGGGYKNSDIHAWLKSSVLPSLKSTLGESHLLSHSKQFAITVNSAATVNRTGGVLKGASVDWGWSNGEYISLLSEIQVYGSIVYSSSGYDTGEANRQLAIFRKKRFNKVFGATSVWLRDVVSLAWAADVNMSGHADYTGAVASVGVVPLILLR